MQILFYEMKERERGKIKKRRRMRRFKGKGMEEPAGIGRARQKGTKSISRWQQGERRCNLLSTLCLSNNAVSPVSLPLFIVSVTRNTDLRARLDDTGRRPPPDTISSSFLLFPLPAGKGDKSILVSGQICLQDRFLTRCIVDGNSFRRISPSCSPSTRNNLITYQNIYKSIYSIYISI